ncbi:class I SAM-dependent methyltransferase [Sphingomonas cavernae]|uniref:Methyltransferase domain-containing protein n=1 Tax=Sphingomonas cavernae TaxID=2320861 RepID=A0A418WLJ1_9SPHN|nr:methyltransferase domain-containing protein [Sphingomonas cavernae]RJF83130.1 methyltransferase domain-containing protein [Sphingomonas cavernae]RJF90878.1 methyltransferase domain-containing protein [Sphingomonas cavernae]
MLDKIETSPSTLTSDDWRREVYEKYHSWKGWDVGTAARDAEIALREVRRAGGQAPSELLEIGYGDGAFLRRAAARGFRCSGVELDDSLCPELCASGIDARAGSISQFGDGQFDLVVAFDVFEHMEMAELLDVLKMTQRKMKYGGLLIARFPNMASPFGVINQYGDVTHCTTLSPKGYLQLANVAQLELVSISNALTNWHDLGILKFMMKPLAIAVRRCVELALGFAYYGAKVPLDPEVTVVVEKRK